MVPPQRGQAANWSEMFLVRSSERDNLAPGLGVSVYVSTRRITLWTCLFAVVIAVSFVAVPWFLDDHRPGLALGQSYGLDVSHHQGVIDWEAVAADDIDFAYIKATEGGDWVDPRFAENWVEARAAGLEVGAYHFFTLCRSGPEQAANFLATVPVDVADLPLAIDLEFAAPCSAPMSAEALQTEVIDFVALVEAATERPMLVYVLSDFDTEYQITDVIDRPRWIRSLYHRPDESWSIWQYSFRASVDGVQDGVDLNVGALT